MYNREYPIDLQKISTLISKKTSQEVNIVAIEKIGSGYHSDGFKMTAQDGQLFFLKRIKSHDLGFEVPERKVASLLVSQGMNERINICPKSIGIILDNGEDAGMIAKVNESTAIYQVQEFQPEGVSYWSLLQEKKLKTKVDEQDTHELQKIVEYIDMVHRIKHDAADSERQRSVYNDGLRSILTNPELTIMLLHDFSDSHAILPAREHGAYIGMMLSLMHKWKDRHDRLSALHGDFWGANLFFRQDGSVWVVDYSRIPWGDPGLDIGWWLSQYLWFYHETGNEYFKELGEKFLDLYVEKSGDQEIRQAVSMVLGLMGIIFISPRFYPNLNVDIGKGFFVNIVEIIKNNQFIWLK